MTLAVGKTEEPAEGSNWQAPVLREREAPSS